MQETKEQFCKVCSLSIYGLEGNPRLLEMLNLMMGRHE